MKSIIKIIITALLLISAPSHSDGVEETAKIVFDHVENALHQMKGKTDSAPQDFEQLVRSTILPHVDSKYFAFKVLGKHLDRLTPEQRNEFASALQQKLVADYVSALKGYNNEKIMIANTRLAKSGKIASVTMKLVGNGKQMNMNTKWRYSTKKQRWLMYDLIVEGISMLQTKQKEIATRISTQGVDTVLAQLSSQITKA